VPCVTHKSDKVARMVASFRGQELDARYLGYFDCYNRGLFYEAHDVLEDLWLMDRRGPDGDFYKGLIQLAGAFVHLRKERVGPCLALLRLAKANLARYPTTHHQLDLGDVLATIVEWELRLAHAPAGSPFCSGDLPKLHLLRSAAEGQGDKRTPHS